MPWPISRVSPSWGLTNIADPDLVHRRADISYQGKPVSERKRAILEERARARQGAKSNFAHVKVNLPEDEKGQVRDQLAQIIGVSGSTYDALANTMKNGNPVFSRHLPLVIQGLSGYPDHDQIALADIRLS